jgi:hypothetical protein
VSQRTRKALKGFKSLPTTTSNTTKNCTTKRPEMLTDTKILEDPLPRINLSTSDDIRREMAKVYRETRFNKILPNNGSKLVYMLTNILKAYEVTEIEKRLADLEKAHLKRDK